MTTTTTTNTPFGPAYNDLVTEAMRLYGPGTILINDAPIGIGQAAKQQTAKEILDEQQAEVERLIAAIEAPKARQVGGGELAPSGYLELAERIGLKGRHLVQQKMLRLFQREEIPVYNAESVKAYMDGICKALTETINATGKTPARWGKQGAVVWGWLQAPITTFGRVGDRAFGLAYTDTIPIEALQVVDRVKTAMEKDGIELKQYAWQVSKVEEYPDPFLRLVAVKYDEEAADEREQYVLFHWDEPSWSILGNK